LVFTIYILFSEFAFCNLLYYNYNMFKSIFRVVIQFFVNLAAINLIVNFLPEVVFLGNFMDLLKISAVLTILNLILKPIIKFFLKPLIILTFGIFSFIITGFLLWLSTYWVPQLTFSNWKSLLVATLIFSVLNSIFNLAVNKK